MDILQTIVNEIKSILNDRSITYVSSDINDSEALTPSHLLHGRKICALPFPYIETDNNTWITRS